MTDIATTGTRAGSLQSSRRAGAIAGVSRCALAVYALIVLLPAVARCQDDATDYVLTAWTMDNGLPSGNILGLAQDEDGYLWLGTDEGLVRFDGFRFTRWGARGEESLPGQSIRALLGAREGGLWIGFGDTSAVARISEGRVTIYGDSSIAGPSGVTTLIQDRRGVLWAGSAVGLARFAANRWESVGRSYGLPTAGVYSLYEDDIGRLWAGTSAGVYRLRKDSHSFDLQDASLTFVQSFGQDSNGAVWATDARRIVRPLDGSPEPIVGEDIRLPAAGGQLLRDRRGRLWASALGGGLLRFAGHSPVGRARLERFVYESVITGGARGLFEDRDGHLWLALRGGGLLRIAPRFFAPVAGLDGITSDGIRAIAAGGENVWVSTGHALHQFSRHEQRTFPVSQTMALHADKAGRLWVATTSELGRLENGAIARVRLQSGLQLERLVSITTDAVGDLWLCSLDQGLLRLHGEDTTQPILASITRSPCSITYTDRRGRVWAGFASGEVVVHDHGTARVLTDTKSYGGPVIAILEDEVGAVFVSTVAGITRFRDSRTTTLSKANGIPGKIVPSLVEDDDGFLWAGVKSGAEVIRFSRVEFDRVETDPRHRIEYTSFDRSDGLVGELRWLSRPGASRDAEGRLWFTTGDKITTVDPHRLPGGSSIPPLRIEHVSVDGRTVPPTGSIQLDPHPSRLTIDYTVVSLSAASKLRFRYKLEGHDATWVEAGTGRSASYADLPMGAYRFRVRATNGMSWSESVRDISVAPAFFQTSWFYLACAFMTACLLWGGLRMRAMKAQRQYALVASERARVSREIHDTLLQTLAAVGLELEIVALTLEGRERGMSDSIRRLRRVIMRCIRDARDSIAELRRSPWSQRHLVDALHDLADNLQVDKPLSVDVQLQGRYRRCAHDTEAQLQRIAQEAVANASRHAHAEHIEISVDYRDDVVVLRVSDDGCGFVHDSDANVGRQHFGLLSMKERAERLGGQLELMTNAGVGTTVQAVVPLSDPD